MDTTGAGDVFHGAFIYGMLQRWELMKTIKFASVVAAIKCTRLGGRTGIPDRQQALRFLRDRNSRYFQTDGQEGEPPMRQERTVDRSARKSATTALSIPTPAKR